jgi:hypothetical protein
MNKFWASSASYELRLNYINTLNLLAILKTGFKGFTSMVNKYSELEKNFLRSCSLFQLQLQATTCVFDTFNSKTILSKIIIPQETNLKLNKDLISLQDYLKLNEKINKK